MIPALFNIGDQVTPENTWAESMPAVPKMRRGRVYCVDHVEAILHGPRASFVGVRADKRFELGQLLAGSRFPACLPVEMKRAAKKNRPRVPSVPFDEAALLAVAKVNPWRLFTTEELGLIVGISSTTLTEIRAAKDTPFCAGKSRPELLLAWFARNGGWSPSKSLTLPWTRQSIRCSCWQGRTLGTCSPGKSWQSS